MDGADSTLMNDGLDKEANSEIDSSPIKKVLMFFYAPHVKYLYNLVSLIRSSYY
jgi:hypothetical protein